MVFIHSFAATVYLIMGFLILVTDKGSRKSLLFLALCLCLALWSGGYALLHQLPAGMDRGTVERISHVGTILYYFFIFVFVSHLSGLDAEMKHPGLLYLLVGALPVLLVVENLSSNILVEGYPDGFWYLLWYFDQLLTNIATMLVLFFRARNSGSKKDRLQAAFFIGGAVVSIALSAVSDAIIGYEGIMTLTPSLVLIWMGCVAFIVVKYRFIIVSPALASHSIFESIDEAVFLVGPDGRLLWSNRKFRVVTGLKNPDIESFLALVEERDLLETGIDQVRTGRVKSLSVRNRFTGDAPGKLLLEYRIMRILDEYDDFIGISVLGKIVNDFRLLRDLHRISGRETDVIQAVFDGLSNLEIADSLNISERTVKSHLTHIFSKLNVDNKIQLVNLLMDYEVIPKAPAQKKLLNLKL